LHRFIECLGICHTVISEQKVINGVKTLVYNASSPDELALVNGMRHFGFEFKERDEDDNMIIDIKRTGETKKYKLLHVLEFNSDRKRMSVIVRDSEDRVMVICKGADSIINARLEPGQIFIKSTNEDLERYAEVGLRTLLVAYRFVDAEFYQDWVARFKAASSSTVNRDKMIAKCAEEIEVNFTLAGCSAIEDKLQDQVGETIRDIRRAGIKVWVLTGDKVETAINIGQSCQLLTKEQNWLALKSDKP
jgi:magnesium-transporting ATPase (P-type)